MNVKSCLLVLLSLFVLTGCSPKVTQPPTLEELETPGEEAFGEPNLGPEIFDDPNAGALDDWDQFSGDQGLSSRAVGEWREDPALETVYFNYDKYNLTEEAQRILYRNSEYLRRNPRLQILLEGHCDERGTEEYNQALGENRSLAVREYLIQILGPEAANRIQIISYGELMPAVPGHTEAAWRFNRRVDFKVAG